MDQHPIIRKLLDQWMTFFQSAPPKRKCTQMTILRHWTHKHIPWIRHREVMSKSETGPRYSNATILANILEYFKCIHPDWDGKCVVQLRAFLLEEISWIVKHVNDQVIGVPSLCNNRITLDVNVTTSDGIDAFLKHLFPKLQIRHHAWSFAADEYQQFLDTFPKLHFWVTGFVERELRKQIEVVIIPDLANICFAYLNIDQLYARCIS